MSNLLTPAQALRQVPGWSGKDTRVVSPLGGLSNRSFKVRHRDEHFVLRLADAHTEGMPLDRQREKAIHHCAAEAGLAPPVVFAGDGILVTRFVAARPVTRNHFSDRRFIEALAVLLRRTHSLAPCGHRFDARGAALSYRESIAGEVALSDMAEHCLAVIIETEAEPGIGSAKTVSHRCCHNDVVAGNLLLTDRLGLIDWEFAADNDPLFDLATPLAYHDLDADTADALLAAYSGSATPEGRERLASLQRLFDALHWLWLARRHSIQPDAGQSAVLRRLAGRIKAN